VQLGVVHLRLRDVAEEEIAAALNTPARSLNGFHPVGLTSGSLDARWIGTLRDAEVAFVFDLDPPPMPLRELCRWRAMRAALLTWRLTRSNSHCSSSIRQLPGCRRPACYLLP